MSACIQCTSATVLISGPRIGALWCCMKSKPVPTAMVCAYFTGEPVKALTEVGTTPLVKSGPNGHFGRKSSEESLQSVLVKSGPKAHFEPNPLESVPN